METSKQKTWIDGFFEKVVNGYMVKDLGRMMRDIEPVDGAEGNCNFPIALYTFSCIEFLGHLTSEKEIDQSKPGSTKEAVWSYMTLAFGSYMDSFKPYESDFVDIFRNGLSHQYFAKNAGVSRKGSEVVSRENGGVMLDADRFAQIFIESTETLRKNLSADSALVERVQTRYRALQETNKQKYSLNGSEPGLSAARSSMATTSFPTDTTTLPFN